MYLKVVINSCINNLEISVSCNSCPLFVMNSTTACIELSAEGLTLSHIAIEHPCKAAASCKNLCGKASERIIHLKKTSFYIFNWNLPIISLNIEHKYT